MSRWGDMETPQVVELVTQAIVNLTAAALAVVHLVRCGRDRRKP